MTTIDSLRALAAQIDGNGEPSPEELRLLEAVIARNTTANNRHVNVDQIQRDLRDIAAAHGGRRDAAWLDSLSERIEAVAPRPTETASPVRAIRGAIVDSEQNRGTSPEYVGWLTRGEPAGEHFFQALSTATGRSAEELRGMDRGQLAEVLETLPASLEQTWRSIQGELGVTQDGKPGNQTFGRLDEARGEQSRAEYVHSIIGAPGPTEAEAAELEAARSGLEGTLAEVSDGYTAAAERYRTVRERLNTAYGEAMDMPEGEAKDARIAQLDGAVEQLGVVAGGLGPVAESLEAGQVALAGGDAAALSTATEALSASADALVAADAGLDAIEGALASVEANDARANLEAGLAEAEALRQDLVARHEDLVGRASAVGAQAPEGSDAAASVDAAYDALEASGLVGSPAENELSAIRAELAGENPDLEALGARLATLRGQLDDASGRLDAVAVSLDGLEAAAQQRAVSALAGELGIDGADAIAEPEALGAGAVSRFHMNQARLGAAIARAHAELTPADFDRFLAGVFNAEMRGGQNGQGLPPAVLVASLNTADRDGAILAEQLRDPARHQAVALELSSTFVRGRSNARFERALAELEAAQVEALLSSDGFAELDADIRARFERAIERALR